MASINLLPWREQRREDNKNQFFILLAVSSAGILLILFLLHLFFVNRIDDQNSKNQYLEQQIALLDQKISAISQYKMEKEKILTRMNLIYSLRDNRPIIVRTLSDMVDVVPTAIYLTELKRTNGRFTLMGRAESNMSISELMRKLELSTLFENPTLNKIETDEKNIPKRSDFELIFQQHGSDAAVTEPNSDGAVPL